MDNAYVIHGVDIRATHSCGTCVGMVLSVSRNHQMVSRHNNGNHACVFCGKQATYELRTLILDKLERK